MSPGDQSGLVGSCITELAAQRQTFGEKGLQTNATYAIAEMKYEQRVAFRSAIRCMTHKAHMRHLICLFHTPAAVKSAPNY